MKRSKRLIWLSGRCLAVCMAAVFLVGLPGCEEEKKIELPQHTKDALSKVRTLAVLPFQDAAGQKDAKGSGKMLVGAVTAELAACPDLKLVERSQLNKVIEEEDLKDMLNASVAAKIGKKVGADTVIVGEVTQYAAQQESSHISVPYFGGGGTSTNHRVGLSIRAVNVADGGVIYARSGSGAKKSGFQDAATDAARKAMKPWRQFFEGRYADKHAPPPPPAKPGKPSK